VSVLSADAPPRAWLAVALGVLAIGTILRLVHLDADPVYPLWTGYITDEGRWTEQARRFVLFGTAIPDNDLGRLHLLLAPLYQATTILPFSLLGVGLASARLVSAVASITLLVAVLVFFRRRFTAPALAVVMIALAFQPDLLHLSRIAIPEMSALLFSVLAFMVLVSADGSRRRLVAAGVVTALAMGFKVTTAPLVPIFAVVAWALSRGQSRGHRAGCVGAYLLGAISPGLLMLLPLAWSGGSATFDQLSGIWLGIQQFMLLNGLYAAVAQLMHREIAGSMGLLYLPVWLVAGLLLALRPMPPGPRRIWAATAVWIGGWLGASAALYYFPDRYVLHIIVPLMLNLGAGLTLLQRVGTQVINEALRSLDGWRRIVVPAWLSLPLAILVTATLIAAAGAGGFSIDRLSHHLVLLVGVHTILAAVWVRWWRPDLVLPALVALPVVVVGLRALVQGAGGPSPSLWQAGGAADLVYWAGLLLLAVAVMALARVRGSAVAGGVVGFYVIVLATAWGIQILPALVAPSYTVRDAGLAIEALAPEGQRVGAVGTAGVLLGTRLDYTEILHGDSLPEIVVVYFQPLRREVADRYRLERRLRLNLGRRGMEDAPLRVYRLVDDRPSDRPVMQHPTQHSAGTPPADQQSAGEAFDQLVIEGADHPTDGVPYDEQVDEPDEAADETHRVAGQKVSEEAQRGANVLPIGGALQEQDVGGQEQPEPEHEPAGEPPRPGVQPAHGPPELSVFFCGHFGSRGSRCGRVGHE
jgi:hypothetical protein